MTVSYSLKPKFVVGETSESYNGPGAPVSYPLGTTWAIETGEAHPLIFNTGIGPRGFRSHLGRCGQLGRIPPTAQSLEDGDLILNDRRVRNRNRRVGGNESLFARQEIEIAHCAFGFDEVKRLESRPR